MNSKEADILKHHQCFVLFLFVSQAHGPTTKHSPKKLISQRPDRWRALWFLCFLTSIHIVLCLTFTALLIYDLLFHKLQQHVLPDTLQEEGCKREVVASVPFSRTFPVMTILDPGLSLYVWGI